MRTREEIKAYFNSDMVQDEEVVVELLMDIRDLLVPLVKNAQTQEEIAQLALAKFREKQT